jgi:hypothetical protein
VPWYDALRERVAEAPDATLAEHRAWLAETHGVVAGLTTIWKTFKQLKLTLKMGGSGGDAAGRGVGGVRRRRGRRLPRYRLMSGQTR